MTHKKNNRPSKKTSVLVWTLLGIVFMAMFALADTIITENDVTTIRVNSTNATFSGIVGIGTTNPSAGLMVYGSGQTTANINTDINMTGAIKIIDNNYLAGNGGTIIFGFRNEGMDKSFAAIKAYATAGTNRSLGDLTFSTRRNTYDTNLTESMRILANGNVGIGTSSSNQKLTVVGTMNFTNASNSIGFFQGSDANVGIGTVSPYGAVLNIVRRSAYNNENIGGLAIDTGVNGESKMVLGADPVNNITYIQSLARLTSYLTIPLTLQPNGGSVGIGTISPANKFHVSGAGSSSGIAKFQSTDANGGFIIINDSNTNFLIGTGTTMGGGALANSAAIRTATGSSLFFNEGTTNRMVINATSGNVGIGATSPNAQLHIQTTSAAAAGQGLIVENNQNQEWAFMAGVVGQTSSGASIYDKNNNAVRMTFTNTGNVGIGTTAPADTLTIIGDVNVSGCYQLADGTLVGGSCASSRDYKTDEKAVSIDWKKFKDVKPKTYNYKQSEIIIPKNRTYQKEITEEYLDEENMTSSKVIGSENVTEFYNETLQLDTHGYGFIYEDVAASYPDRVTVQDGVKKVNYGFDWVLDNRAAIQELRAEMDGMKAELCALGRTKYC